MRQDEEKLHLEKIKIERERIEVEKEHFNRQLKAELIKTIITAFSILIPLLIALLMINSNFKIEDIRAEQQYNLSEEVAKSNFILKAAEIVMNTGTINGTKNRAEALKILFPDYLGDDFAESFSPIGYGNSTYEGKLINFRGDITISDRKNGSVRKLNDIEFSIKYEKDVYALLEAMDRAAENKSTTMNDSIFRNNFNIAIKDQHKAI